jgi:hypothetical protein
MHSSSTRMHSCPLPESHEISLRDGCKCSTSTRMFGSPKRIGSPKQQPLVAQSSSPPAKYGSSRACEYRDVRSGAGLVGCGQVRLAGCSVGANKHKKHM